MGDVTGADVLERRNLAEVKHALKKHARATRREEHRVCRPQLELGECLLNVNGDSRLMCDSCRDRLLGLMPL